MVQRKLPRVDHAPEAQRGILVGSEYHSFLLCRKEILTYMEIDAIMTAIGSVGFPIVFCILLFAYVREQTKTHKEEVDELKNVIAENNNILAALKQLIEDKLNG